MVKDPQKIEIYAIIYSPIIIIPINQTTDSKSPCIIIHLGDIKLVSDENTPINTIDFEEKTPINLSKIPTHSYYDVFILTLTSFKIVYLNNLEELESKFSDDSKIHKKLKKNTPSKFYQESRTKKIFRSIKIIKKMQVKINIQILKEQLYLYTEKPRISLNIQIEKIIFGLHPFILTKIKQLEKTFTESVENSEDLLLFEKKHLLENAIKIGIMNRFDKNRDVIERRFIILSDMYLYFFDGPDKPIYESYYYLREANIEYGNSLITIMNKNKEKIVLFSEDPENFEEWADILNKVIEKSNVSNKVFNIAKKSSSFEQNNIAQVKINLAIKEVKLNLYDADHILWLAFCFDGLEVKMNKKPIDFDCLIEVCKFHVLSLDNIPNSHPDLKYLISNCPFSFVRLI